MLLGFCDKEGNEVYLLKKQFICGLTIDKCMARIELKLGVVVAYKDDADEI